MRWGLALGGGGARGLAHLGVLSALEEAGLRPDVVTGTSMGALVAAIHAMTGSARETLALARRYPLGPSRFVLYALWPRLLDARLKQIFGRRTFADLALPCAVSATHCADGAALTLREGEVWPAVRASINLPGVFRPVIHEGRLVLDGGFSSIVPIRAARALGAEVVIGVFVGMVGRDRDRGRRTRISAIITAADAMGRAASAAELAQADLLLEPPVTDEAAIAFHRRERIIRSGYEGARRKLAAICQLLSHAEGRR